MPLRRIDRADRLPRCAELIQDRNQSAFPDIIPNQEGSQLCYTNASESSIAYGFCVAQMHSSTYKELAIHPVAPKTPGNW